MGGAEISMLELVGRLKDRYEFHIILPGDGPLKEKAEDLGAHVSIVPWPDAITRTGESGKKLRVARLARAGVDSPGFIFCLSKRLREIDASVWITNGIKCHVLASLVPRSRHVSLVWYLRDGLEGRMLTGKLLSLLSFRCDQAICISNYIAGELRAMMPGSLKAAVLYNIVDPERYKPGLPLPPDLRKESGELWFGVVGAVTSLKGQDLFLEAAEKVASELPSARFLIVGANFYATEDNSAYENKLRSIASRPVLAGKIKFLGFRRDIPAIVSNLDVLVQSNKGPEGLGRSVLEAMASAVPVISVDRWGPGELVSDAVTGLLFPPADTSLLAEKMLMLGRDSRLRKNLGANGRNWVLENLSPEKIVSGFQDIVERVRS